MNKQRLSESSLTTSLLNLGRQGLVFDVEQRDPSAEKTQTIDSLSDQLAGDVAVFSKADGIISNNHGVFVPRSLLGTNTDLNWEVHRSAGGTTRVTIKAFPKIKHRTVRHTGKLIDCAKELQWIAEHRQEYAGLWVALDGDRLIAASTSAKEVYNAARESGVDLPLVELIEGPDELPFGGW